MNIASCAKWTIFGVLIRNTAEIPCLANKYPASTKCPQKTLMKYKQGLGTTASIVWNAPNGSRYLTTSQMEPPLLNSLAADTYWFLVRIALLIECIRPIRLFIFSIPNCMNYNPARNMNYAVTHVKLFQLFNQYSSPSKNPPI